MQVAVVIPAFDAEPWLAEALESVLSQSHAATEVVVVDDGSRDRTAEVAERYLPRVRVVRRRPGGPGAARNLGVSETAAPLIAFLDADDLWPAERLAHMVAALADETVDALNGRAECFASPDMSAEDRARLVVPEGVQKGWLPGSFMVRRAAWQRVGPFDEALVGGEFIDWVARALAEGLVIGTCDAVVLRRRIHATSMSVRARSSLDQSYLEIVRGLLARRRS